MLCQNLIHLDGSYTLARQDEKLVIMMLIWALPEEFDNFTSALLLQKDIDKAKVIEAFLTEENNCRHCTVQSAIISNKPKLPPSSSLSPKWCNFCKASTHKTDVCFALANAKKANLECRQTAKQEKKQKQKAKQADEPTLTEVTGSASTIASLSSLSATRSISDSNSLWCTDSGASSHMTPHRHWFRELKPHRVPIELADNSLMYSEGIENVVFYLKDSSLNSILFTNVLYVPQLQNNLLSFLFFDRMTKGEVTGSQNEE